MWSAEDNTLDTSQISLSISIDISNNSIEYKALNLNELHTTIKIKVV